MGGVVHLSLPLRAAHDRDAVAHEADLLVVQDVEGGVGAVLGLVGHQQRAVVHIGRTGVAREERRRGLTAALTVNVHALRDALVEPDLGLAVGQTPDGEGGLGGGQVGAVLVAHDLELFAEGGGVAGVFLGRLRERAVAGLDVFDRGLLGLGEGVGGVRGPDVRVQRGVVGVNGRQIPGAEPDRGAHRMGGGLELVVLVQIRGLDLFQIISFSHSYLTFNWLCVG